MLHMPPRQQKSLVGPTYAVTIGMLVIGQIQVSAVMEIKSMKDYLAKRYFVSLIQFFISFLSIQLYGFFYRMIVEKSIWVRILAGLWTYQVNTLSIMKPAQQAPYFCLAISLGVTYIMMGLGAIYGHAARRHERGLFISRHKVILWSERLFVVTCFGIIVSAELNNVYIEFPTLVVYTLMSNVVKKDIFRHHVWRLPAKTELLSPQRPRRLYINRSALLFEFFRFVYEYCVDDSVVLGNHGF
ncbi:uncharacterized protein LOC110179571 isoform X2 [Drosophila serrata]|uniref:uncharacterized protein LOC110179571 isoform X2 n=1 Tax=Drosophila serrata TaxID=7274 RepID=UPI000A1D1EA1|nr:uncharacterized protein LOC110179571 isoform X2 [Drosophila serrata]